jgi:hypothetical protein
MDDQEVVTPVEETPAVAAPEAETEIQAADEGSLEPQGDAENGDAEDDLADIEYKGFKVRAPKGFAELIVPILEKGDNLEAGYTKSFMETAEVRKTFEGRLQDLDQQERISAEIGDDLAQLRAVDGRLAQFQQVNWQEWQANDPQAANAAMAEMMQLQTAQTNLRGHVEGRKTEIAARQAHLRATLIDDTMQVLSKPDPTYGWDGKFDEAKQTKLTTFGKEMGLTDREIADITHPVAIKVLNLAFEKAQDLKKLKAAIKAPASPQANPVPIVTSGKTRASVDPDKLTTEQWVKWRNQQVHKAK